MATTLTIEYLIIDPEKRGGRPMIKGTGITVHDVAVDHKSGMTVEQIVEEFDLTPGQVYAALSYYFDHKAQIDQEIRDGDAQAADLLRKLESKGQAISGEELKGRINARKKTK